MAFFGNGESFNRVGDNLVGLVSFPGTTLAHKGIGGVQHTKAPITTASSVLGVKFNGGVALAADTLGSYGSLARFRDCPRIFKVNDKTLVGAGGDYADFQFLKEVIDQKVIDDECTDDGFQMKPKGLYHWLTRFLYNKRSKFDPLWVNFLIAGLENGVPFLGAVDKLGTAFQDNQIATGFGSYIAVPLLREAVAAAEPQGGLTEQQAIDLLKKCIRVLYYRDARSWPQYQIGVIKEEGVEIHGPFKIDSNWEMARMVEGFK